MKAWTGQKEEPQTQCHQERFEDCDMMLKWTQQSHVSYLVPVAGHSRCQAIHQQYEDTSKKCRVVEIMFEIYFLVKLPLKILTESKQWNLVYELWVSRSTSSVRCESWSPQHQASFETWWLPAKCPLGVKKHFSSQIKTSLEAAKRCYSCIACVPREEPREFKCFEHMKKDVRNYNNTAKQGFLFCFVD